MVAEKIKEEEIIDKKDYKELVFVGDLVVHNTVGSGEVLDIDLPNSKIMVKFDAGEKMFMFPQAFEKGFLKQLIR